jgi:hypothetical protein
MEKRRGNVLRFFIEDSKWIDRNWRTFAGKWPFGTRRDVHLFFDYDWASLEMLVGPWWDPNVLVNPSIVSSPRTVAEIHDRLQPGMICFSVAHLRLRHCEVYFHPKDVEDGVKRICAAAEKTEWWFRMGKQDS